MRPSIGDRVKILRGPHTGREGFVTTITTAHSRLSSARDWSRWIHETRARLGVDWINVWFEIRVNFDGSPCLDVFDCSDVEILTDKLHSER